MKPMIREYIEALLIAVVLAGLIIAFVAQSFLVHGSSMEPTLAEGQRLLVDKITYRLRPPERGEIIVFHYPADPKRKFIRARHRAAGRCRANLRASTLLERQAY